MAGSDIAVTDERVADAVIEYAARLGKVGTTDTVTFPVARNGHVEQATLLVGPASQIALTDNDDMSLEAVELPEVDAAVADVRRRLDSLIGHAVPADDDNPDTSGSFVDYDAF
jgi:hypothetical protein